MITRAEVCIGCERDIEPKCWLCPACEKKADAAERVSRGEYTGGRVFIAGYGDEYFADLDELFSWCIDHSYEVPPFVFTCTFRSLQLDAEAVLDAIEDDADRRVLFEEMPESTKKSLQQVLDKWVVESQLGFYEPDLTRIIEIPQEARDEVIMAIARESGEEGDGCR